MDNTLAIGLETLPWTSRLPPELLSRRQALRIPSTYQAAIPAEISELEFQVPASLAALAEEAAQALMRADAEASGPLSVPPLASILLRTESAASSQIEHLTVSARQLAVAEIGQAASRNAELVADNVTAMRAAIDLADRLDETTILAMHQALMRRQPRAQPGQWRDVQVWIGASGLSPADASFVPPAPGRVPHAMADLVRFLDRTNLPVLVHVAIAHAQFETIHPFVDGNGRTGRALMHAMIRAARVTSHVTVPVSAGLLSHLDEYVQALTKFRQGDIRPIVEAVADAAHRAVWLQHWLSGELEQLAHTWQDTARPRKGSALAGLTRLAMAQPALTTAVVVDALGVSPTAATHALDQAVGAGILTMANDKLRNRVWLAQDVLDLLDEFAARAGRRSG